MDINAGAQLVQDLPWRAYRCKHPDCGRSKRLGRIVGNGMLLGVCKIMVGTIECGRCHHLNEFYGGDEDGEIIPTSDLGKYKVISDEKLVRVG
jgi:phage FluMu protein Com